MGIAAGSALGGGGVTVGGGYAVHKFTSFTIEEKLKSEGFDLSGGISSEGAWSKMQTRVTTKSKTETDESLKTITEESKFKFWCSSKNSESYGSRIASYDDELLGKVKFYCFLTIKEKLEASKVLDVDGTNDSTRLGTLLNNLKGHSNSSPALDTEDNKRVKGSSLSEIKKSNPSDSSALKDWCKEAYELPYMGSGDPEFSLVGVFCVKNGSQ